MSSKSTILSQVVAPTIRSAKLTSSQNPSVSGQPVTFTAAISSPTVTVTGPVTFTVGGSVLGTVQLKYGGRAQITTSALPVGSTTVKVTYYGNSNVAKSSASLVQTVH